MLQAKKLSLFYGTTALLDDVDFGIERGERVCLVGRNGAGKSTLLGVIAGTVAVDSGEIQHDDGLRIATLPQAMPEADARDVFAWVADGLGELGGLVAEYHHRIHHQPDDLDGLARVQQQIEAGDGWSLDARVEAVLSRLSLDGSQPFAALSGGLKRRVLLARALVTEPDLLLLDEPTNHLDIASIRWLEEFLAEWRGALLFITHDRAFLRRLATRILELDRGRITSWPGDYDAYLRHKAEALQAEALERARTDKKLAQEEVWIRKGIQARRTRNEGRVRALKALRAEVAARRERLGTANLQVAEAERSGKLVVEATDIHLAFGGQPIVAGLSTTILRGDKVGLIGPNGVGKTTLLKLLLGQLAPDAGAVRIGTKLEIAYFDQLRASLKVDRTVAENIGDGREFVEIGGARRHVMSYLQDFLFTPDRARSPVSALSGGEASRVMLAQLFARPSNLLVLDEPTNDLDVDTLDLLEERLAEYQGTVLLVSHDRAFLDNVVTRSLVFEGQGRVREVVGGYSDWLAECRRQGQERAAVPAMAGAVADPSGAPHSRAGKDREKAGGNTGAPAAAPRVDARAIRQVTREIEKLEAEQERLGLALADGSLFREDPRQAAAMQARLSDIAAELEAAYARWEALDG